MHSEIFPVRKSGEHTIRNRTDTKLQCGAVGNEIGDVAEAVKVAKQYLSYFQGPIDDWTCADQRTLRHLVPENRVRVYDVRRIIETLADTGSWIELRGGYGVGLITGFLRIEGRPMGLIANDPRHLGGALDSPVTGYGFVYNLEIVLLFATLVALGPLVRRGRGAGPASHDAPAKFGLAEVRWAVVPASPPISIRSPRSGSVTTPATRPLPPCAHAARKSRTLLCLWWPLTTASCPKRLRQSAMPRLPACSSWWR